MKPLISLIIPCYNVQNYVQAALQSVADSLSPEHRAQVEWLIVDDGATDQTPDIIARFAEQVLQPQQTPHRIIRQSNAGLSAARNTGLAHAQGEYVLFLDSDDIFVQAALDKILAVLAQQQPDIIEFDAQMFVQPSDLSPQNPTLYGQYFRDTVGKDHQSSLQRAFEENRWYVWSRCYRRSLLERHPFIAGNMFEEMMYTPYVPHQPLIFRAGNRISASRRAAATRAMPRHLAAQNLAAHRGLLRQAIPENARRAIFAACAAVPRTNPRPLRLRFGLAGGLFRRLAAETPAEKIWVIILTFCR